MKINEIIAELFQPGKNWEWKFRGSEEAVAEFEVGGRHYIWSAYSHVRINRPDKWEVQFRLLRNDADPEDLDLFGTTGTGNSAQVMSIAVDITRTFLQEYGDKVLELTFNAKENSRIALYTKMVKRLLPTWDMHQRYRTDTGMEYYLTNPRAYELFQQSKQEVVEKTNPDIHHNEFKHSQQIGDFLYKAEADNTSGYGTTLVITAYDGKKEVAQVEFIMDEDADSLTSANTWVLPDYQELGIATTMYAYAKMLGNDITPSRIQTDQGHNMWRSWNQKKQSKHILPRGHKGYHVNESLLQGRNLSPDTEAYVKSHEWKLTTIDPSVLDTDAFDDPYGRVIDIDVDHPVNFKDPIIVDANGVIIDGFHRAYQAQRQGLKQLPAYVPVEEQLEDVRVWEDVPQPGPSSGAPKQFGADAKIQTRQMTAQQIIASIPGVPYYNNVVDDWDAKDYSWGVTKKVIEYATYLKDHPESLAKLPPAIVLNGKFEDGAHRVSALWLLQQRMDPKNPLWKNAKLNVQFVKQGVTEAFDAPYPMTWEHGDESHDALVKLPDGTNLSIMFSLDYGHDGDPEWQVEFWRNNSQDITGKGDSQRIFATVLNAIQQFIQIEKPEYIQFSASKETEDGERNASRSSLYTSLVKRYASSWGYKVAVTDLGISTVFKLRKMSSVNEDVSENFDDGKVKGKSRPGRVKQAGASCDGSVSELRARARKYGGEKGKMYHWCANMKSGKSKS